MFWRKIRDTQDEPLTMRALNEWKDRIYALEAQVAELMKPGLQAAIDEYRKLGGYLDFEADWRHITRRTAFPVHFNKPSLYTEKEFREKYILPLKAIKYEECMVKGRCGESSAGQLIFSGDVRTDEAYPGVYTWTTTTETPVPSKKRKKARKKS